VENSSCGEMTIGGGAIREIGLMILDKIGSEIEDS
jgi:hypothetical protein